MVPDEQLPEPVAERATVRESGQARTADGVFPVVGVGASAGGLEAFTSLLQHLPPDTGMAFVFVQHLAPSHESMLTQLLSRETAMLVKTIEDGIVLSPNQVYVIPPNAALTVSGLALALTPREAAGTAIDGFLRSLAASRKNRGIAVILSGTGSDGTLGVQAIAEEGGIVIAQDPESARFDGMPRSAIATGCVDFVLSPEAIAVELARISREPHLMRELPEIAERSPDTDREFQAIIDLLRAGTGIDFSLYRQTTVRRRVLRRVAVLRQGSLGGYVEHARENPDEVHALAQDILIRVTRFFRDPESFDVLKRKVFPALIRKTSRDGAARIWVAGCSTGEEAYSMAICFLEVAEQMQSHVPLQLFATDINEAAIEKARRGAYIDNIAADVSPERLARYFVREGREFQVSRRLRDLCIFSRHDLLNDPPFSRMGLVSCRNVLIYLDTMQEHAFSRFHFALNPGGFLMLGKSETAASSPGLFTPVDKGAALYVRQESARYPGLSRGKETATRGANLPVPHTARPLRRIDVCREADRVMTERYGPPRVIVNLNLEVVAYGGEAASFAPGMQNEKLLELAKNNQPVALRNAVRTANRTGQSIRMEQVRLEGPSPLEVAIAITPLGPERLHCLVVFEERAAQAEAGLPSGPPTREDARKSEIQIGRLEKELASSRAYLESVITEQEASNEEVVAANEELQSANEELESSKEELEAANEELTTVNQELQVRNTELGNAREFAQATIDTVRGALVVLGPDLRVLKANRSFFRMFRMSAAELDHRFIYELGDRHFDIPRLRELLERVLPESRVMEDFEVGQEDAPAGRRILLMNAYRFEGAERILLAIEDVTESRRAEQQLRESHKMEALGYLAAGVAHDFNNLLTGVIGNASLLLDTLPEGDPGILPLRNVIDGGQRAANLTRQLLAYTGKGRFYLERVNLSELVVQTGRLTHPSIPSNVQLRLDLDKDLPTLLADPGQMQQVVMNLMINAVEAIGEAQGIVNVRTGRQTLTDEPLADSYLNEQVAPGEYVFLEVLDNGSGMDEQTIRKIFDPFFTTKFTGRGLGLAAVLGIVRLQKGALQVHSVPGRGSSFRVLFPAGESLASPAANHVTRADLHGAGTVLVVDDEELIRNYSGAALHAHGYSVLVAQDGAEAVRIFQERADDIRLVLLDMAMPGMDGLETLERIREIRADIPILICSGFGDQEVEARFEGKNVAGFFPKPYTVTQLAEKVKECIALAEAEAQN